MLIISLFLLCLLFAAYIVWLIKGPLRARSENYNPPASRSYSPEMKVVRWSFKWGIPRRITTTLGEVTSSKP